MHRFFGKVCANSTIAHTRQGIVFCGKNCSSILSACTKVCFRRVCVGADGSWECCRRAAAGPQTLEAVKKEVDKESRFTEKPKVDKEAEKKKKEKEKEKEKEKKFRKERKEASKMGNVEDDGWACVGTPVKRGGVGKAKSQSGSGPNSPLPISRQGSRENLAKKPATNRGGFAALMADSSEDDDDSDASDKSEKSDKSGSEESEDEEVLCLIFFVQCVLKLIARVLVCGCLWD